MASYQIPAPTPMSLKGNVVENWLEFENAWSDYIVATELRGKLKKADGTDNADGMEMVAATLCRVMGNECKRVMNKLTALSGDDKKNPKRIIDELNKHFLPQRNVLYERFIFNTATQKPEETIDDYVLRLRQLADYCEFGDLQDSLIRDRIVIGTRDESGRERLLRERPVPNLERVVESLRTAEISRVHRRAMQSNNEGKQVDYTDKQTRNTRKPQLRRGRNNQHNQQSRDQKPSKTHQQQNSNKQKCKWCGKKADHTKKTCPARDASCHKCSRKGHYATACLGGKTMQEVDYDEEDFSDGFLGEVDSIRLQDFWSADIMVNKETVNFKLDTGSKVTVLGDDVPWLANVKLEKLKTDLKGPGGVKLSHLIKGVIPEAQLQLDDNIHKETVYVMKGQRHPLLSKAAIQALQLLTPAPAVHNVDSAPCPPPNFKEEFPRLFKGLGRMKEPYDISLREDAVPVCLYTPRRIPYPILPKLKVKLDSMVRQKVISPVTGPTEWCSGMVIAPKSNNDIRICVDLTHLNKAVKREVHPMATVDENLAKLQGSKIFSKLDANSGFWQIPLTERSRLLTTFVTPYGRYCFNRLPFGISSAPEIFQRTMSLILEGAEGVVCHMDDIMIHGPTQEIHDGRVREVLRRLQEAGITLNEKCEFSKGRMKFLGHIVSSDGIEADPQKTEAIHRFPAPTCVNELQRFNGMVNQLAKFIPDLSTLNEPLRQLLKKDQQWIWDQPQQQAFQEIKEKLTSSEVLAHYDLNKHSIVAADACQDGIGAVLMQLDDNGYRRPISYASRSLTETEKRYAVIEKEALAATWACQKFSDYILGTIFTLETDHRPLVPLLSTTDLSKLPPRVLRFRLRMARYSPEVKYVQGKHQTTADALSRAPVSKPTKEDIAFINEVEEYAQQTISFLPASERRLNEIQGAQEADATCKQIMDYCTEGWPPIIPSNGLLRPYWDKKQHFTCTRGLLLYDNRLVIPPSLQLEVLQQLHEGHLGISKCQSRARDSVWWPLITKQIEAMVNKCRVCSEFRPERREPLMAMSFPHQRPWSRVASDFFHLDGKDYLLVVDYTSRWFEVKRMLSTTTASTIRAMSEIFSTYGIPELLVSDNGPQYDSAEFKAFAKDWGFTHITSSPRHPEANGEAERAVQTAKNILKKNEDPYLGLLAYRTARLQNGYTPSELLMGRRLRTRLPTIPENLEPKEIDTKTLLKKEENYRAEYSSNYNKRHKAKTLPVLQKGDQVYVRDQNTYGEVTERLPNPRSYRVLTDKGSSIRRNRRSLVCTGESQTTSPLNPDPQSHLPKPPDLNLSLPQPPLAPAEQPADDPAPAVRKSGRVTKSTKMPDMHYY